MASYDSWIRQRRGRGAPTSPHGATVGSPKPGQPGTVPPTGISREREPRFSISRVVEVCCMGEEHRAQAVNVSLNGICLLGTVQRPPGSPVTIRCGDLRIDGTVAWSGLSATGVKFLVPLIPEVLASFRADQE